MCKHVQSAAPRHNIHMSESDRQYPICGKICRNLADLKVSCGCIQPKKKKKKKKNKKKKRERNHKTQYVVTFETEKTPYIYQKIK